MTKSRQGNLDSAPPTEWKVAEEASLPPLQVGRLARKAQLDSVLGPKQPQDRSVYEVSAPWRKPRTPPVLVPEPEEEPEELEVSAAPIDRIEQDFFITVFNIDAEDTAEPLGVPQTWPVATRPMPVRRARSAVRYARAARRAAMRAAMGDAPGRAS